MIPVCAPYYTDKELEYVTDCVRSNWISSKGKYIEQFESRFSNYCDCKHGITTTNGTTALHLALASAGLKEGDEVIVPAFTMIASALSVVYCGAKPVLVDAERDTWNIDAGQIEDKITDKTKAIMPVHIYGHPCDMGPIMELADKYGLYVIEDAAEAHGAEYRGRKAGGIGHAGCFSFYANKIITTGEGGMVVTNDGGIAEKARSLKDLAFVKSKDRKYLHNDVGFNLRMTNIQAAIGLAQFEIIDQLVEMRRNNARLYNSRLKDVDGIVLPAEKSWAKNVYWMYSVLVDDSFGMSRDRLMIELEKRGIDTRTFFIPMNEQPVFLDRGLFRDEKYPVARELSQKGLYLPSSSGLKPEEISFVCDTIRDIREGSA